MSQDSREKLKREAEGADGRFPESAKLSPGRMIAGTVVRYTRKSHDRYGPAVGVVICEEDSEKLVTVWAYQTALRRQLADVKPLPGEYVVIKRHEDSPTGSGRWSLFVDRTDEAALPDFEAIEREKMQQQEEDLSPSSRDDRDDGCPF